MTSSLSPPAIQVENVSFSYPNNAVLKDVCFAVHPQDFVGIIGPNGGGKTTLLKLLLGFLNPTQGSILIQGRPPYYYPNGIAYVPQTLRFDKQFPLSVMELVLQGQLSKMPWWGKPKSHHKDIAFEALLKVKLTDCAHRAFGELSGGQIQRALIARALACQPQILLLDEPTANVDIQAESDIYEILVDLKKELIILMVTHDIGAIIHYVKRVLCVQGYVIELNPNEVCEHFALGLYHTPLLKKEIAKNKAPLPLA